VGEKFKILFWVFAFGLLIAHCCKARARTWLVIHINIVLGAWLN